MGASAERNVTESPSGTRKDLLLQMYDQLFNDINRHILVVWQSVGVVVGALAVLALTEKKVITIDVATSLIVLLAAWLVAHLYDASYWYNRNLVMIANIEKLFLEPEDLRRVHYYFGKHRPRNRMISHLRIQYALAVGLSTIVMMFHLLTRVVPGFSSSLQYFELQRAIPYLTLLVAAVYLWRAKRGDDLRYAEFLTNSPGIEIPIAEGISYSVGHGFRPTDRQEGQG